MTRGCCVRRRGATMQLVQGAWPQLLCPTPLADRSPLSAPQPPTSSQSQQQQQHRFGFPGDTLFDGGVCLFHLFRFLGCAIFLLARALRASGLCFRVRHYSYVFLYMSSVFVEAYMLSPSFGEAVTWSGLRYPKFLSEASSAPAVKLPGG